MRAGLKTARKRPIRRADRRPNGLESAQRRGQEGRWRAAAPEIRHLSTAPVHRRVEKSRYLSCLLGRSSSHPLDETTGSRASGANRRRRRCASPTALGALSSCGGCAPLSSLRAYGAPVATSTPWRGAQAPLSHRRRAQGSPRSGAHTARIAGGSLTPKSGSTGSELIELRIERGPGNGHVLDELADGERSAWAAPTKAGASEAILNNLQLS